MAIVGGSDPTSLNHSTDYLPLVLSGSGYTVAQAQALGLRVIPTAAGGWVAVLPPGLVVNDASLHSAIIAANIPLTSDGKNPVYV